MNIRIAVFAIIIVFFNLYEYSYSQSFTAYNKGNSGLSDNYVGDIEIFNSKLWLGTLNGISVFDGFGWNTFNTSNSGLKHNIITDISISKDGLVWIANYNQGVLKYDGQNWINFNDANSELSNNNMVSIKADSNNVIWIGSYGGLNIYDNNSWTIYNTSNSGIPDDDIRDIDFEDNGNIWVPTWYGGIAIYDGNTWTVFNTSNSELPSNSVSLVKIDTDQCKWIGTTNGLVKLDGLDWNIYNTNNSPIPDNDIRAIEFSANGSVIVGTRLGGLAIYSGTDWTGDQDISGIAANEQAIQDTAAQIRDDLTPKHYIGQLYGGGIIFWLSPDGEHGLIMSLQDISDSTIWSNVNSLNGFAGDTYDGYANSIAIINQEGHTNSAASLCLNHVSNDGSNDWFLPSTWQMDLIGQNAYTLNYVLINDGDSETDPIFTDTYGADAGNKNYWTSTENYHHSSTPPTAYGWYLPTQYLWKVNEGSSNAKSLASRVRAIREF